MILKKIGEAEFGRAIPFASVDVDAVPAAEMFLSADELKKYKSFPVEKRRRDWLAGRWVAKNLVMETLGKRDAFSMIEISADDDGQPQVDYPGSKAENFTVSLTHSGGKAAAAIDAKGGYIGIDLEKIEERHPSWSPVAFHKDELRDGMTDSDMTRMWTVKEAVLKLLGIGLTADLHEVRLRPSLTLYGKALERHRLLGSNPIKLSTWQEGEYWYTVAVAEGK